MKTFCIDVESLSLVKSSENVWHFREYFQQDVSIGIYV
jgi:hypothetical protein